MENDFEGDLDGEMLNYSEMDSVIDSTLDGSLSFSLDDHPSSGSSSSGSSSSGNGGYMDTDNGINDNSNNSSSSKRKRKPVDPLKKKPRIDYKNPYHADRLLVAINSVISSLEGEPDAFHKNIMMIAKSHNIPYNTLRDNFLRARGIEPRAHRNSERKRQAEALAAAAEKGVVSAAKPSTLIVQTQPVSVHVAGAMNRENDPNNPNNPNYVNNINNINSINNNYNNHNNRTNNNINSNHNNSSSLNHSSLPVKAGPLPPRGLALAYALAGPQGEAHAPPIGPRATSYLAPLNPLNPLNPSNPLNPLNPLNPSNPSSHRNTIPNYPVQTSQTGQVQGLIPVQIQGQRASSYPVSQVHSQIPQQIEGSLIGVSTVSQASVGVDESDDSGDDEF